MNKKHMGSSFDDFLREEDLLDASEATATKRTEKLQAMRRIRLTQECAKLQASSEQTETDENFRGEAEWPEYIS